MSWVVLYGGTLQLYIRSVPNPVPNNLTALGLNNESAIVYSETLELNE